jgi:AmpD protein
MSPADAPSLPSWEAGWYRPAQHHPSPNFGPRPAGTLVDLVVLHSISLPPGVYGGNAVHQLFANQLDSSAHPYYAQLAGLQVSAHFFIRRDGALWQFVSCDDRAWHAGASSHRGRENCNDYSIGIELEGLEGDPFESAQYNCLLTLLPALAQQYPVAALAGHEHIAPGRKADPGPGMQWQLLQAHLGWAPECFPEGVLT